MSQTDLPLAPGIALQLQFQHQEEERHGSRVIGYLPGKSILVTTPRVLGGPMPARVGWPVNVRYFAHKNVYAFTTQICHVCTYPFPYLHLSYPADVITDTVRSALRVPCELMATVIVNNGEPGEERLSARILDISITGLRLELLPHALQAGQPVSVEMKLEIGKYSYLMAPTGMIRSLHGASKANGSGAMAVCGIEFDTLNRENYLALYSFVYSTLTSVPG